MYILANLARVSHRWCQLSSNVRRHQKPPWRSPETPRRYTTNRTRRVNSALRKDIWLSGSVVIVLILYVWLLFLRPGGEGWGRGWNMVAFLLYAAPTAFVSGAVAIWRSSKASGHVRKIATLAGVAGLVFPLVCILAIRLKA